MYQPNAIPSEAPKITLIQARKPETVKLRVAAYARVSSDSEDQQNSYIAQVDYYTRHIAAQESWELADIYADEGISGLVASKREEFNRMIQDCRDGKIDRVLVKSISRFARNTKEYIQYVRELLRLGNRLENGKKFCKDAPTLEETRIHTAVVSAMNEMFSLKSMKAILQDSIRSALAPKDGETSLAAIDSRLSELREQQYRLLQLAAAVGADSTQYDEELKKVSMEFSALVAKRSELEKNKQDTEQADERAKQLAAELEAVDTGITTFDEVTVRQLISAITVLSEEKLLIRFKDGTEIERII